MSVDIFEFWSQIEVKDLRRKENICHPRDRDVLSRINSQSFDLSCLPLCFAGPLKSAPIVLLYLSLGLDDDDHREAETPIGRRLYWERCRGEQPLPGPKEHSAGWRWWSQRTRDFGDWRDIRSKVAILNIGAYHSKTLKDYSILSALPSCRVSIEWAQTELFPQAIAGKRVVICLRSAKFWGLDAGSKGRRFGKALFAPLTVRAGHMRHGEVREEINAKVRAAINRT